MVRAVVAVVLMACLLPATVSAWGAEAHRHVMARAIDLLPVELRPFFDAHREELILRVNDPDLWRVVGWDENAHHFLDFGVEAYGQYPFKALPREYDRAVERFGVDRVKEYGLLPWRFAEMFGELRRAFEGIPRNAPFAADNAVLFAAVAAHYIQDAHQPLHATINYDGQQTGQPGVHARFESGLIERFGNRLRLAPRPIVPIASVRDFAFDTLLASYQQVDALLQADKEAIGTGDVYDDAYYEAFFRKVQPMLERQLNESITATASVIVSAWEAAGKPALRVRDVRPVERVRRPR